MGLWLSGTYTRSRVEARRSPTTTDLNVTHRTTTTTAAALLVASGKQCQSSRDFKTPAPSRSSRPGDRVLVCRFGGSSTRVKPLYDHLPSTANQVASCLGDLEKAEFTTFWSRKRILLGVFHHSAYLFRIFHRHVSPSHLAELQNRPPCQADFSWRVEGKKRGEREKKRRGRGKRKEKEKERGKERAFCYW